MASSSMASSASRRLRSAARPSAIWALTASSPLSGFASTSTVRPGKKTLATRYTATETQAAMMMKRSS